MDHVLTVLGLAAAYAVFVYAFPTRACGACAKHRGPCPKCKGTGRRFWPGACLVRRAILAGYKYAQERREKERAER